MSWQSAGDLLPFQVQRLMDVKQRANEAACFISVALQEDVSPAAMLGNARLKNKVRAAALEKNFILRVGPRRVRRVRGEQSSAVRPFLAVDGQFVSLRGGSRKRAIWSSPPLPSPRLPPPPLAGSHQSALRPVLLSCCIFNSLICLCVQNRDFLFFFSSPFSYCGEKKIKESRSAAAADSRQNFSATRPLPSPTNPGELLPPPLSRKTLLDATYFIIFTFLLHTV